MLFPGSLTGIYLYLSCFLLVTFLAHQANGSRDSSEYPTLELPWGIWQADSYDTIGEFYTFKNVRFGKPPTGNLRFAKSVFPDPVNSPELQDNDAGCSCIEVNPTDLKVAKCSHFGLGEDSIFKDESPVTQNEDCLFLDLYVPKSAIESGTATLPVVVWFYGGGYIFGSKEVASTNGYLYNPVGLLRRAKDRNEEVIFVVGNYRLGAFGWLAGSYVEENAYPNAGLSDQHLILRFVQNYIDKVGGDKTKVSAWGQSAGGGSILNHLIAEGGNRDPLFRKAVLQSPAYSWAYDRSGALNRTYQGFANAAGCDDHTISCLRKLPSQALIVANLHAILAGSCNSIIPFGPAIDGTVIKGIGHSEFAKGNYWKNIETIIGSHVEHEAEMFVPKWPIISTPEAFLLYLNRLFPHTTIPQRIAESKLYTSELFDNNQTERLIRVASDAYFTSNLRQLYQSYNSQESPVYLMKYRWPVPSWATHGADLIPSFWRADFDLLEFLKSLGPKWEDLYNFIKFFYHFFTPFVTRYQTYLVSHAIKGNPNTLQGGDQWPMPPYDWSPAIGKGDVLDEVMEVRRGLTANFHRFTDDALSQEVLDFWTENAQILSQSKRAKESRGGSSKDEL